MPGEVVAAKGRFVSFRYDNGGVVEFEFETHVNCADRGFATLRGEDIAMSKSERQSAENSNRCSDEVVAPSFFGASSEMFVAAATTEIRTVGDRTLALQFDARDKIIKHKIGLRDLAEGLGLRVEGLPDHGHVAGYVLPPQMIDKSFLDTVDRAADDPQPADEFGVAFDSGEPSHRTGRRRGDTDATRFTADPPAFPEIHE